MTLETLVDAERRLTQAGYRQQLVVDGGELRSTGTSERYAPADMWVSEVVRFEGISDPADEAMILALATRDGEPVGTITTAYGPNATSEEADLLRHLHRVFVPDDERAAHDDHDHIGAVFADRRSAEAAIGDLRVIGLGSDHLGAAVSHHDPVVFEHDESQDLLRDVEAGTGAGAAIGVLGGMLIFGLALPGIGTLGAAGILAVGAATGIGGAMLGGYAGVAAANRELDEHERLSQTPLQPGEVLVVACSHNHPDLVTDALERHGGRLLPTDQPS